MTVITDTGRFYFCSTYLWRLNGFMNKVTNFVKTFFIESYEFQENEIFIKESTT